MLPIIVAYTCTSMGNGRKCGRENMFSYLRTYRLIFPHLDVTHINWFIYPMAKETQIPNSKQDFDLRPPRKLVELAKASWSSLALKKN